MTAIEAGRSNRFMTSRAPLQEEQIYPSAHQSEGASASTPSHPDGSELLGNSLSGFQGRKLKPPCGPPAVSNETQEDTDIESSGFRIWMARHHLDASMNRGRRQNAGGIGKNEHPPVQLNRGVLQS